MNPLQAINEIKKETDKVVLFHSANGKDSICLLEMLSKQFKQVLCVYMYLVKDLEQINKYIKHNEAKYPNCKFIQIPSYVLHRMMHFGELGLKKDSTIPLSNLSKLADIGKKYNIDWTFFGFKKSDGLNRRLMLNTYEGSCINRKTKRVYPLAEWKNSDCIAYIKAKKLLKPVKYSNHRSCDVNPKDGEYLYWCKKNYPNDLQKILKVFPLAGAYLFEYEQGKV